MPGERFSWAQRTSGSAQRACEVSEADIDYIELCLEYNLPPDYRRFLLEHADELRRIKERLPGRAMVWTDPDDIVRGNIHACRAAA
jgi:hypothetical protein